MDRDFTPEQEKSLDEIERRTSREAHSEAYVEIRAVLAGHRRHVFLRSERQECGDIYDAAQLWLLLADEHDEGDMAILAGAQLTGDPAAKLRAYMLVSDFIEGLAHAHANASAKHAVAMAAHELQPVYAEVTT